MARLSGQKLIFECAPIGLLVLLVARLFTYLTECILPNALIEGWNQFTPFEYLGTMLTGVLVAVFLAVLVNKLTKWDEIDFAKQAAQQYGDLRELLLQECLEDLAPVEVSLRNDKSYIGFVQDSDVQSPGDADIGVIPIKSGYRDKDTRELKITDDYTGFFSTQQEQDFTKFKLYFPLSEIVSVRNYIPTDDLHLQHEEA